MYSQLSKTKHRLADEEAEKQACQSRIAVLDTDVAAQFRTWGGSAGPVCNTSRISEQRGDRNIRNVSFSCDCLQRVLYRVHMSLVELS
jgi:hypothetical protein